MIIKLFVLLFEKKLDLNDGKPFIKYSTRPEDAEERLKKLRKHRSFYEIIKSKSFYENWL